jgi:hypothetical protein
MRQIEWKQRMNNKSLMQKSTSVSEIPNSRTLQKRLGSFKQSPAPKKKKAKRNISQQSTPNFSAFSTMNSKINPV